MKIAFITTQSIDGSTVSGRIAPLAEQLSERHEVHVIVHGQAPKHSSRVTWHMAGEDPFVRTASGKVRLTGLPLIGRMLRNAWLGAQALKGISPDAVVVVKTLPENVLAVWLARQFGGRVRKIVLDVDDFELSANKLTSLIQRAAVHAAERMGAVLASHIVVASPFLQDHMQQLTQNAKPVTLIPTGPIGAPQLLPQAASASVLTFIGSLSVASGHRVDLLPDILRQVQAVVPEAKLRLIGTGDDVAALKKQFASLGLEESVLWQEGRFGDSDIAQLLADTAILLDPVDNGITNRAKSSYRVMLSLCYGLPVVTSNVGIRSVLLPGEFHARSFAKPADAGEYAQKIIELLKHPLSDSERQVLFTQARQFSWPVLAKQYEQVITAPS
jgi:glycosyltransferase involved in cell wall biosynthesis